MSNSLQLPVQPNLQPDLASQQTHHEQYAGNIYKNMSSYNNIILNLLWSHKFKLVFLIIITTISYLNIPKLIQLQEKYEKKSNHKKQMLSLKELKDKKEIFDKIIDVRTKEEYEEGHVVNSINIEFKDIIKNENLLKKHVLKDDDVLIYCKSGRRASLVVKKMVDNYNYDINKIYLTSEPYNKINKIFI